jgi:hypothetical protein
MNVLTDRTRRDAAAVSGVGIDRLTACEIYDPISRLPLSSAAMKTPLLTSIFVSVLAARATPAERRRKREMTLSDLLFSAHSQPLLLAAIKFDPTCAGAPIICTTRSVDG